MNKSLKTFMSDIIDYAGYFPPEDLPLGEAINNFAQYRQQENHWMLGRFVLPYRLLPDLDDAGTLFSTNPPYRFSILGASTEEADPYRDMVEKLAKTCEQFKNTHGNRVKVEYLETPLPKRPAANGTKDEIRTLIEETSEHLHHYSGTPDILFFEVSLSSDWRNLVEQTLDALVETGTNGVQTAFKLRCGGGVPSDIPTVEQVDFTLKSAADRNVALKCTAGLHHPIRGRDRIENKKMHGYVNVFGGGMLQRAGSIQDNLSRVLSDEDPTSFSFEDGAFSWRNHSISPEEIRTHRREFLRSFGSCSFTEPAGEILDMV